MFAPVRGFKPEEGPPQKTENAARRATFAGLRRALSRDLRIHRVSLRRSVARSREPRPTNPRHRLYHRHRYLRPFAAVNKKAGSDYRAGFFIELLQRSMSARQHEVDRQGKGAVRGRGALPIAANPAFRRGSQKAWASRMHACNRSVRHSDRRGHAPGDVQL